MVEIRRKSVGPLPVHHHLLKVKLVLFDGPTATVDWQGLQKGHHMKNRSGYRGMTVGMPLVLESHSRIAVSLVRVGIPHRQRLDPSRNPLLWAQRIASPECISKCMVAV